jgi:hypothetical protein
MFLNLVVLALAYSDVFWYLHMYIHVILYVYCCKQGRIYARAKRARAQGGKFPGAAY